jgi:hypothetical protein
VVGHRVRQERRRARLEAHVLGQLHRRRARGRRSSRRTHPGSSRSPRGRRRRATSRVRRPHARCPLPLRRGRTAAAA